MVDCPIPDIPGARHVMSIHEIDTPMDQTNHFSKSFLIQAREPHNLGSAGGPAMLLLTGITSSREDVAECVKNFFAGDRMFHSLRPSPRLVVPDDMTVVKDETNG